jgi:hypothetical protein
MHLGLDTIAALCTRLQRTLYHFESLRVLSVGRSGHRRQVLLGIDV